jgi:hypothetical protein
LRRFLAPLLLQRAANFLYVLGPRSPQAKCAYRQRYSHERSTVAGDTHRDHFDDTFRTAGVINAATSKA